MQAELRTDGVTSSDRTVGGGAGSHVRAAQQGPAARVPSAIATAPPTLAACNVARYGER